MGVKPAVQLASTLLVCARFGAPSKLGADLINLANCAERRMQIPIPTDTKLNAGIPNCRVWGEGQLLTFLRFTSAHTRQSVHPSSKWGKSTSKLWLVTLCFTGWGLLNTGASLCFSAPVIFVGGSGTAFIIYSEAFCPLTPLSPASCTLRMFRSHSLCFLNLPTIEPCMTNFTYTWWPTTWATSKMLRRILKSIE